MQKAEDDPSIASVERDDILSRFLQLPVTDPRYLRDIILNFIIAGKDTTAATLSWFIYVVAKHPVVQGKLAKEIKDATGSKDTVDISEFVTGLSDETLEKMHYLDAALTETLRLYPGVPVEPLTEEEIEELIADLLDVQSKAAEAQEALEEESQAKVEADVRNELAQSLAGDELDKDVAEEMAAFKEEWELQLDELETESAHLLEQLDGAGIELSSLYKWIEKQAPNGCHTEAWKKRTHWVGNQLSVDATESVSRAEEYLQTRRPGRRHGKILEEGASGFLEKK